MPGMARKRRLFGSGGQTVPWNGYRPQGEPRHRVLLLGLGERLDPVNITALKRYFNIDTPQKGILERFHSKNNPRRVKTRVISPLNGLKKISKICLGYYV
jgi:hypothetical protein